MALSSEPDADVRRLSEVVFQQLDADKSGFLSNDEVLEFAMRIFGEEAFVSLSEADADGDGQLNWEEWLNFCQGVCEIFGKRQFMVDFGAGADVCAPSAGGPKSPKSSPARAKSASPKRRASASPSKSKGSKQVTKEATKEATKETTEGATAAATKEATEEAAAATKIQSTFRGKKARREAEEKKSTSPKAPEKRTTVSDIWEYLSWEGGAARTTIALGEVIVLYDSCVHAGMNVDLAECVPMEFEDKVAPEELTVEEVIHLCNLLLENPDLSEEIARQSIEERRPFPPVEKMTYRQMDGFFNLRHFRKLVSLLSLLMRIDELYIVLIMQFVLLGVFEMTDIMAALIIERGTMGSQSPGNRKNSIKRVQTFDSEIPHLSVLKNRFKLDAFQRLLYNGGIVDDSGAMGIVYGDISMLYDRAIKNMPKRFEARAAKKKSKVSKANAGKTEIIGRSGFEILLEELHDVTLVQRIWRTPVIMAIEFSRIAKAAATIV